MGNKGKIHEVNIPYSFWIGRFPVTNKQFSAFVESESYITKAEKDGYGWNWDHKNQEWIKVDNASWIQPYGLTNSFVSIENHPVVMVSWYDALAYCNWLSQISKNDIPESLKIRLPSEAEWEKSARGDTQYIWPWGDKWEAWRCNSKESGSGITTPVGAYSPDGDSPYRVADMAGNVWEWTQSLWGKDTGYPTYKYPYNSRDGRESLDAPKNVRRILRGGSFAHDAQLVRNSCCLRNDPEFPVERGGFRIVLAPSPLLP